MYKVKHEPIRQSDLDLMEVFMKAHDLKSVPLGHYAEYARDKAGLSDDEARASAQRIFFHRSPQEAAIFDYLAERDGQAAWRDTMHALCQQFNCAESEANSSLRNAIGGANAFAKMELGAPLQIVLLKKGEDVGYWP